MSDSIETTENEALPYPISMMDNTPQQSSNDLGARLLSAVSTIAAQTGGPAETIGEWLCSGGLAKLFLTYATQEEPDALALASHEIASRHAEGVRTHRDAEQAPPRLPSLPETLINRISDYGLARTDGVSECDRIHLWTLLIREIEDYARAAVAEQEREKDRLLALLNTPELVNFRDGVVLEAAHQRERWGSNHDGGKTPADWHWLVAHLAGKALFHAMELHHLGKLSCPSTGVLETIARHRDKALHHCITTAAAVANWHSAMLGLTNMRPGTAHLIDRP